MLSSGIITVTTAVIGLKKLNIAKAKKLEEQARKVAQEQAERAKTEQLRKAQEESKQAAEKFQRQLEEKARLKAEQQAKIKAEKEAEKQGLKELDVKSFYSKIKESTKNTRFEYKNEDYQIWYDFNLSKAAQRRKDIINDMETLEQSFERKRGETFGDYLTRLADIRKSKMSKTSPVEKVRAKLKYDDTVLESVQLTVEEMTRLAQWKPEVFKGLSKEEALGKLKHYTDGWVKAHTDDISDTSAYQQIEDILLKKGFKRYDSSTYRYKSKDYEVEPLYRWLNIDKGNYKLKHDGSVDYDSKIESVDSFVDEYFKAGAEYTAPRMQSCSKNKGCAETYFHDNNQT